MKTLDDLAFEEMRVVAGREMLRSLNASLHGQDLTIFDLEWLDSIVLLACRVILTSIVDRKQNASLLALIEIDDFEGEYQVGGAGSSAIFLNLSSILHLGRFVLAGASAPGISAPTEQDNAVRNVADHLCDLLPLSDLNMRYAEERLWHEVAEVDLCFTNPLWAETPYENGDLATQNSKKLDLLTFFSDFPSKWSFWLHWYLGFADGRPIVWGLQQAIASIDDAIWRAGPSAVAAEIKVIQDEFDRQNGSSEPRQPDFEPESVERVLSNKKIAATGTAYVSVIIGEAIEAFHAETGRNDIPEPFVPLAQMPSSLHSIGAILRLPDQAEETKQQLREEIGRLNAKVAKLEKELEALKNKGDPVFRDAVKKSLGDWKLWAAVVAGGWIVLGDVEGAQARLENIQSLRDEIFGAPPAPSPDIAPFDDPTVDV